MKKCRERAFSYILSASAVVLKPTGFTEVGSFKSSLWGANLWFQTLSQKNILDDVIIQLSQCLQPRLLCVPGWLPMQGYLLSYQLLVKIKHKKTASETEQLITSRNQFQIWFIHQLQFFLALWNPGCFIFLWFRCRWCWLWSITVWVIVQGHINLFFNHQKWNIAAYHRCTLRRAFISKLNICLI